MITLTGSGFQQNDRVVFEVVYYWGDLTTLSVAPTSVALDGTSLEVIVPDDAASGAVRLERHLQPKVVDAVSGPICHQAQPAELEVVLIADNRARRAGPVDVVQLDVPAEFDVPFLGGEIKPAVRGLRSVVRLRLFLFRQFFLEFPVELEEAARLDGAGYFRIYWNILLPNATGILMALGALAFVGSWNGFLWPLVVGQTASSYTVQVVLSKYITAQVIALPMLFAAALVGIAPLVVVFLIMQRYIVQGVRLSGIKG